MPGVFAFVQTHSTPADRIFTTGTPALYLTVDRLPAVRERAILDELLPALPGRTDEEKLRPFYEELVRVKPKVVVLDPEHGSRKRRYLDAAILPFLSAFHYVKVSDTFYLRP